MNISLDVKKTFNIQHSTSNSQLGRRSASALDVECWTLNVECSPRPRQRGVALIITLIMLAVITFMATTFLVLSRRERGSVTTNTDQTTARLTADSALERAKVELLGTILGTTNDQKYSLMVPTNFFNPLGFDTAAVDYRTNVNYDRTISGNPLTVAQFEQNLANLLYNPRPPVFVTNRATGGMDFRYYLDLNRNGRFEPSGYVPNVTVDAGGASVTNGTIAVVGDPQWVGVLRFPDRPHSADNPFLARWTYLVLPAGQTLDVNYIHNQTLNTTLTTQDGFMRNQGVGGYEINLAAFLADLNTNIWYTNAPPFNDAPYTYKEPFGNFNTGTAFDDARSLVRYRYANSYASLAPARVFFPNTALALRNDNIDEYADGPLMFGTANINEAINPDNRNLPWAGSDNTNHFFTPQDFFDRSKVISPAPLSFVDRMMQAGASADSYNRYTFYRMLEQLGTDSVPSENRMNVNFMNVDASGNVVPGMETNLFTWPPLQFFTNAAARMFERLNLHDTSGRLITVTNIPVWPATNNYYTPAVHRILQLAANMFEATTNSLYPCIYRPLFSSYGTPAATNIFVSGYELVNGPDNQATPAVFLTVPRDLNDLADRSTIVPAPSLTRQNFYGVPWVIGARKGFPAFNQVEMQSVSQITRKMKVSKPSSLAPYKQFEFTQLYLVGVSNVIGVSLWNSYQTNYPRAVYIQADGTLSMLLTNDLGLLSPTVGAVAQLGGINPAPNGSVSLPATQWQGAGWVPGSQRPPQVASFQVPLFTNYVFLPDLAYQQSPQRFVIPPPNTSLNWPNAPGFYPQPQWGLNITNRIRCMIFDGGPNGRVIDYVQLGGLDSYRNLTSEIQTPDTATGLNGLWSTNSGTTTYGSTPLPAGLLNQIQISTGSDPVSETDWANNQLGGAQIRQSSIDSFRVFMKLTPLWNSGTVNTNLEVQLPFNPTAKRFQPLTWQVNDPLVHYLASDLNNLVISNTVFSLIPPNSVAQLPVSYTNLTALTSRYSPWGGSPLSTAPESPRNPKYNVAVKDPLIYTSDSWDFPTNKLPNAGWLGRVHRGTPWQTVYLKSPDTNGVDWAYWSGDGVFLNTPTYVGPDAALHRPMQDRALLDLFTATVSDNAARGQLSVNQTNLAAWSAVLSGVITLTNLPSGSNTWTVIQPAGVYDATLPLFQQPPLAQIVAGINLTRANTNPAAGPVFPNNVFRSLGDILATPQLSMQSPFLNTNTLQSIGSGLSDEVMERIPQQIMGLLTLSHSPRFVVYSYGQTLQPADRSRVLGGPFNLLCTNYQITAETATRAVIRVEGSPDSRYATTPDPYGNKYPPRIVVEQYNVLPP